MKHNEMTEIMGRQGFYFKEDYDWYYNSKIGIAFSYKFIKNITSISTDEIDFEFRIIELISAKTKSYKKGFTKIIKEVKK